MSNITKQVALLRQAEALNSLRYHLERKTRKIHPRLTEEEIGLLIAELIGDLYSHLSEEKLKTKIANLRKESEPVKIYQKSFFE